MTTNEAISEMTERIVQRFHPVRVILFGSHARGDARPDSDVDLLVVLPQVENKRESAVAIQRELSDIPIAKDIIITTPSELERFGDMIGLIYRPALREGRVLYEAS
jgi:predicted nucleotidyltransferase